MKDITKSLSFFMRSFSDECRYRKTSGECVRPKGCACHVWSQIWAYVNTLVPVDCRKLTIDDFSGVVPGHPDQGLDPDVVTEARKRLIRYCWGDIPPGASLTSHEAMKLSAIDRRRENGTSLVIHGEPYVSSSDGSMAKVSTRKLGRTLLASIVMKEVIQRRLFDGHAADTYEWVDYHTMKQRLMAKDEEATTDYQSCDWLVVDNIYLDTRGGDNMRVYAQNMLDSVLMERIDQQLPTILVFQFDIRKYMSDLNEIVGVGMAQIAQDTKTLKIALTKRT